MVVVGPKAELHGVITHNPGRGALTYGTAGTGVARHVSIELPGDPVDSDVRSVALAGASVSWAGGGGGGASCLVPICTEMSTPGGGALWHTCWWRWDLHQAAVPESNVPRSVAVVTEEELQAAVLASNVTRSGAV